MTPYDERRARVAQLAAEAFQTALTNSCMTQDFLRLSEPVRNAIELVVLATIDHSFFQSDRVSALIAMTTQIYRQQLDQNIKR